jgi:hypothetical protein
MVISVAAGWLLGAGALHAQNKTYDIIWPAAEANRPAPGEANVKAVVFSRPPVGSTQSTTTSLIFQQVGGGKQKPQAAEADIDFVIRTEPPGRDRLFQRLSEDQFFDTIRQENQARPGAQRVYFPERLPVSREPFVARNFKRMETRIEPEFVVHRRLLFEQPNFDRAGWDLGPLTVGITTGMFAYDVIALPYHAWTRPLEHWETSAGKCMPGDRTPLYFYPEQFSLTGLVGQASAVAGGIFVFP